MLHADMKWCVQDDDSVIAVAKATATAMAACFPSNSGE